MAQAAAAAEAAAAARVEAAVRALPARRQVQLIWAGTANPEGSGLLLRGREHQPAQRAEFDPAVLDLVRRLARLAGCVADALRDCPDPALRRSAAILAARAHPVRVAFDD